MQHNAIEGYDKIAVIIPLYNGEKWIRQTLASIFSQSLKVAEVIVVDDGSKDNSWDIVSKINGIRLFKNPLKGANHARVFGIAQSNCSLVAMLDQDDILHPEHFEQLSNLLLKHPESPAAIASAVFFEKESETLFKHHRKVSTEYELVNPWDKFPFNKIPTPSSVLMRTSSLNKIGGWQVNWPGVADLYCWFALSLKAPLLLSKATTIARRVHHNSYSTELRKKSPNQYFTTRVNCCLHLLALKASVSKKPRNDLSNRMDALTLINQLVTLDSPEQTDIDIAKAWKKLGGLYLVFPKHIQKSFCSTTRWHFNHDKTDFKNNQQWIRFICSGLNTGFPRIQDFTKHSSEKELSFYLYKRKIKLISRLYIFIQLMRRRKINRQKSRQK